MAMTKMYHSISGQIVGDTIGTTTRSYLGDGFGNVVGTTKPDSTLEQWFAYRPYGSDALTTGTGIEPVVKWGGARRMYVGETTNPNYDDTNGCTYAPNEGLYTNGNYGQNHLIDFPAGWNPFVVIPGRFYPIPPTKKPPRQNPPPVEIIDQPVLPPRIPSVLPGNSEDLLLIVWIEAGACFGCCATQIGIDKIVGDFIPFSRWSCVEPRFELKTDGPIKSIIDDTIENTVGLCEKYNLPPFICTALKPGGPEIPDVTNDSNWKKIIEALEKLKKAKGLCDDIKCFVECWTQMNDSIARATQPRPWQLCGLQDDVMACQDCCDEKLRNNPFIHALCYQQCDNHY